MWQSCWTDAWNEDVPLATSIFLFAPRQMFVQIFIQFHMCGANHLECCLQALLRKLSFVKVQTHVDLIWHRIKIKTKKKQTKKSETITQMK